MAVTDLFLPSKLLHNDHVIAGFSTRFGGDDEPALAAAVGFDAARLFMATQVHGATILTVEGHEDGATIRATEADGLSTSRPGTVVAVRTADCVPILIADVRARAVAAVHAGWRGLVAGVIGQAIDRVKTLAGAQEAELRAAIGPAIGPCCFEVSHEVARTIAAAAGDGTVVIPSQPRPHVDLPAAARLHLLAAGLTPDAIEAHEVCTRCNPGLLHSYRRDGPGGGRQVSFIGLSC